MVGDGEEQPCLTGAIISHDPMLHRVAAPALSIDADIYAEDVTFLEGDIRRFTVEGNLVVWEGDTSELARIVASELFAVNFGLKFVYDEIMCNLISSLF